MADLAKLVRTRGSIKGKITRVGDFVSKFEYKTNDCLQLLKQRKKLLDEAYKDFDEIQYQVEELETDAEAQHTLERDKVEELYCSISAKIASMLDKYAQRPSTSTSNSNDNRQIHQGNFHLNLPTLNLKPFSGHYKDWLSFDNMFKSIIDSNDNLGDCQKFQYLKSCLEGEAARAVESLSVTNDSYKAAWEILESRFKNTRLDVQDRIYAILKYPNITKSTHSSLRALLDTITSNIAALKQMQINMDEWHALTVLIIVDKLDFYSLKEWQAGLNSDIPTFDQLKSFLEKRCQLLESMETINPKSQSINANRKQPSDHIKRTTAHVSTIKNKPTCYFCKKNSHTIYQCHYFLNLNVTERTDKVNQLKLCENCLKNDHLVEQCTSKYRCRQCQQRHNTLLHKNVQNDITTTNHAVNSVNTITLLSTAIVMILDKYNQLVPCRALLDPGSMSNYITTSMINKLGLPKKPAKISVTGIGQIKTEINHSADITIRSRVKDFSSDLHCLIIDKITGKLPLETVKVPKGEIPSNMTLADPNFADSLSVHLLIGTQLFLRLLHGDPISIGSMTFHDSHLGWIVGGAINCNKTYSKCNTNVSMCTTLEAQVARFWELESEAKVPMNNYTTEERACERYFVESTTRLPDGKFLVRLPFKNSLPNLGNSRDIALKQFYNLERNLLQKPRLKEEYVNFMREYIQLNHMQEVSPDQLQIKESNYLPHHCVLKDSTTTKLRVVFNASLKTTNGLSLNDNLLCGPTIQQELFSILTRFRTFKYVLGGDVAKMYRMVQMHPSDAEYQRILWRESPQEPLKTYSLRTLTYGTKPASFIATRCIKELAIQNQNEMPRACEIIQRDMYVDDLLTGADDLNDLIKIRDQIIAILAQGGFQLRKFASNHEKAIISDVGDSHLNVRLDKNEFTKTLGLYWNPLNDILKYDAPYNENVPQTFTKRTVLGTISQIFDPLGLLGPIIVKAKIMLQELWSLKIDWDEKIPDSININWIELVNELKCINNIHIPRNVIPLTPVKLELHGFSDASTVAYGAAIYIRSTDSMGNHQASLLCAKSRVAPLKTISLPRLELSAALLLARLANNVSKTLGLNINEKYYWTDSTITLAWIRSTSKYFNTFVANRIGEIQTLTDINEWNHIAGTHNPADLISRGVNPSQLNQCSSWFNGPSWLITNKEAWPTSNIVINEVDVPERRSTNLLTVETKDELPLFSKFSTFNKTLRTMAWVLRFINNCSKNKPKGQDNELSVAELDCANKVIVRVIQKQNFPSEYNALRRNTPINKQSKLINLNVFLDEDNIIRVGGRLKNSMLNTDVKYPIILPRCHITDLIIEKTHLEQLHAGHQGTLIALRSKFWIINARSVIRKILRYCYQCNRAKPPAPIQPIMGNLPRCRVEPHRPFLISGVDFAGPIFIKESRGRGKRLIKAYIALFVCFATKAVHLELVGDLASESFINCIKRIISRRGHIEHIYSDNGTNFVGANRELNEIKEFFESDAFKGVKSELINRGITWHFIPPKSPHMGGIWEINVKSVKYHLKRTLGQSHLTYEEMYTLLVRIEAILNSRPITPISTDPNDLEALTPAHFLIGQPLLPNVTEYDLTDIADNRLSRWQRMEQIRQNFWRRWSKEYLTQHLTRINNKTPSKDPKLTAGVGGLVVLVEDNIPPQLWRLGRITKLHPGNDGITRVVTASELN